ncbi:MAG: hypothetical protein ABI583_03945 [Betaproteobacteria bacterium]
MADVDAITTRNTESNTYYPATKVDELMGLTEEFFGHLSALIYAIKKESEVHSQIHELSGMGTFLADNYIGIVEAEYAKLKSFAKGV